MKCNIVLLLLMLAQMSSTFVQEKMPVERDKRTIDSILRSVADAFGYDIQKRPSLLQAALTTPSPTRASTFPPPLKPLPPAPKPAIFDLLTPRASLPPAQAPPPRTIPSIRPKVPSVAPLPPLPRVPLIPPKAPPAPPSRIPPVPSRLPQPRPKSPPVIPRASPPPPPPMPAASMQSPPSPAPLGLTETFQKSFNLNFNWNKNVMPINPSPPAASAAAPSKAPPPRVAPAQPPLSLPKPSQQPPPRQSPPPPPPAQPPLPPPSATPSKPGGQRFIHKPQLYQDYDYANIQEAPETLIIYDDEDDTPVNSPESLNLQLNEEQVDYNYPEYEGIVNQDYSESENNYAKEPQKQDDPELSREHFKKSVNEFWNNYPLAEQHGYKYIAEPEGNQPNAHNPTNFPREFAKYEEYDVKPRNKLKKVNYKKANKTKSAPKENNYHDDKSYTRIYLIPKHYLDEQVQYEEAPYESEVSEEKTERRENGEETIAHPLYYGVLTPQLHQLASSESDAKPWSVPFDYDLSGSEIKSEVVKINQTKDPGVAANQGTENCCYRDTSSGDFDFYTVPEPEKINYAQYEKLFSEDDNGGLSKNAKIQTNQKTVSIVRSNKFENPVSW